jgi:hypothetical protein
MAGQLTTRHDAILAFDDKIVQLRNKDTAEALAGTANALATMELARQLRVQNLLALAAHPAALADDQRAALRDAQEELLAGYRYQPPVVEQQSAPAPRPYAR